MNQRTIKFICLAVLVLSPRGASAGRNTFLSTYANYKLDVPWNWGIIQKAHDDIGEHLILNPKYQRVVELNIIAKKSDRPLVSMEIDSKLKVMITGYNNNFTDTRIERGPSVVPMGNRDSVGYLVNYNAPTPDGQKMSVRETINFLNIKWGPSRYLHVLITVRCPLYLAESYSPTLAKVLLGLTFWNPEAPEDARPAEARGPLPEDSRDIDLLKSTVEKK